MWFRAGFTISHREEYSTSLVLSLLQDAGLSRVTHDSPGLQRSVSVNGNLHDKPTYQN